MPPVESVSTSYYARPALGTRVLEVHVVDSKLQVWLSPAIKDNPELLGQLLGKLASELGGYFYEWPTYIGSDKKIYAGLHTIGVEKCCE